MEKLVFNTLECPDGYEIAEDVLNNSGSLIITKNTIINETIRQRLITFKVKRIAVCERTKKIMKFITPKRIS